MRLDLRLQLRASGPDHGENHLEGFESLEGVGLAGGHQDHLPALDAMGLAGNDDLGVAFDHLYQGVKRRGVFAQALPFVEGEQGNVAVRFLDDFATDDRTVLVVHEFARFGDGGGGESLGFG